MDKSPLPLKSATENGGVGGVTLEPPPAAIEEIGPIDSPPRSKFKSLLTRTSDQGLIGIVLIALIIGFSLNSPAFHTIINAQNILLGASALLVVAVGQTFVIISGGVDLSVGSVTVFGGVVAEKALVSMNGGTLSNVLVAFAVATLAGLGWGILNGLIIAKLKVNPLIATLGTLGAAEGLALILTNGGVVQGVPYNIVSGFGNRAIGGYSVLIFISGFVALLFGFILAKTRYGHYTYAIGSNGEASRRVGINVDRQIVKVYALCGMLAGLAGFLSLARFGTVVVSGHSTDNLQSIAAVVLGGASLFGGVGKISGTVIGVFIPVVLLNGFVIAGVQSFVQEVVVGIILIGAVYLDQTRRSRRYTI